MACRRDGAKLLSEPMLEYWLLDHLEQISFNSKSKFIHFHSNAMHLKMSSAGKWRPFCLGLNVLNLTHWHGTDILEIETEGLTWIENCFKQKSSWSKYILECRESIHYLRVPDLEMICSDLARMRGYRDNNPGSSSMAIYTIVQQHGNDFHVTPSSWTSTCLVQTVHVWLVRKSYVCMAK